MDPWSCDTCEAIRLKLQWLPAAQRLVLLGTLTDKTTLCEGCKVREFYVQVFANLKGRLASIGVAA
jgi:hypothetical protein